ncbi:MAG: glycosyltransferase family 2 protein [Microscillaceae bacterium]|nr:glycosyltransferase family 2 protein [Microscillaceae bacterium]
MTTKLAVVILNYNGKHWLEQFLPSVVAHSQGFEIVVADNASTDDSIPFLQVNYPQIHILILEKNWGFAEGYNRALAQIQSEYYVLLNSDVEVTPHWIEPLLDLLEANPEIVACQPKMLAYYQKNEFEYAGAAGGFVDRWGYPFCRGRLFDTMETDQGQYNDTSEIFWASGACLFIRGEIYQQIGGLDGDFFAHMEEIDLCWRLKNAGHKIFFVSQSVIYHVGGGTLSSSNSRKTFLNFRNNLALLCKNLPLQRLIPTLLIRILLDGAAALYFISKGNHAAGQQVFKAYFSFFSQIGTWLGKRRKTSRNQAHKELYPYSVVFQYFLQKKKYFQDLKKKPEKSSEPTKKLNLLAKK